MFFKRTLFRAVAVTGAALALSMGALGVHAQQKQSVINLYSSGDTNITDWLQNIVVPAFEKEYPQYKVQFTNSRAAGDQPIVDRAIAALDTKSDPQVEVMDVDPRDFQEAIDKDLWYQPTEDDIPNLKNVSKAANVTPLAASYRGSQVLIAYNSDVIKEDEVPKTFADLVEWIKKHPGRFVYCRPDKGGSGGNFVIRAIYEVSGKDPEMWDPAKFDQKLVDEYYPKAWDLLKEIHPFIYDNGSYPAGNNPVLELFANGEVDMISAWSDQAIQGINKGILPESTKLLQFTDLPFPGGYTQLSIPKNAANLQGAKDFVNFMLSPEMQTSVVKDIGGFPAISWDLLPKELQKDFNSVITDNVPLWKGGDYDPPRIKGWYDNVATNIKQGS
jgi:putative spermidine/putrescine transport system substrate-binding protein